MNPHRHLSTEEIFERQNAGELPESSLGCATCEQEASSLSHFLAELRRTDAALDPTTEWDDLLLRNRIREAVARERPHSRSIFDRFAILRPAFVSALVAILAFVIWSPLSRHGQSDGTKIASLASQGRLPAWTPLPDEADDEGLAVLAAWTPNEEELAIAGCGASCLAGLTEPEEETLLRALTSALPRPKMEASPL